MTGVEVEHRQGGSGEPLVLLHGLGSCLQIWEPVVAMLREHHEVCALDLPGYGASPPLQGEPTVPALVDAVERALDNFGLERPHLAGNSLGGWIAAELAARDRAASVTAISPAGLWLRRELLYSDGILRGSYALGAVWGRRAEALSRSAVGRAFLFGLFCARPDRIAPEAAAYQARAFAGSPSFLATLNWIRREQAMPRGLERIACPFTVAWGTRDLLLLPRQAPRWQRLVPGARLVWLPGLGHAPMADDPALVGQAILQGAARAKRSPARPAAEPA